MVASSDSSGFRTMHVLPERKSKHLISFLLLFSVLITSCWSFTEIFSITTDPSDNTYYVGNQGFNFFIGKHTSSCGVEWSSTDGSTTGDNDKDKFTEIFYDVIVASDGLVYGAGSTSGDFSSDGTQLPNIDAAVVVYNPSDGSFIRREQYDVESGYDNIASSIIEKADGNLLVAVYGSIPNIANSWVYQTRLLDINPTTLQLEDVHEIEITITDTFSITVGPKILGIVHDVSSNSIVAVGNILGRGVIWIYSLSTRSIVVQSEWGTLFGNYETSRFATDGQGAYYVVGSSSEIVLGNSDLTTASTELHAYVIRFDVTDSTISTTWVRQLDASAGSQIGKDIAIDPVSGNIAVIGSFDSSFDVTDDQTSTVFSVSAMSSDGLRDVFLWYLKSDTGDFVSVSSSSAASTTGDDRGNALSIHSDRMVELGGVINDGIDDNPVTCDTALVSPSPSPTATPTATPSLSVSSTPSSTPSVTASVTASLSVSPSVTATRTPSPSITPSTSTSVTVSPTSSVTASVTPSPSGSARLSLTATATSSPSSSVSTPLGSSVSPSVSTSASSLTVTLSPGASFTSSPSAASTPTQVTPSPGASVTSSSTASITSSPSGPATVSSTGSTSATPFATVSTTTTPSMTTAGTAPSASASTSSSPSATSPTAASPTSSSPTPTETFSAILAPTQTMPVDTTVTPSLMPSPTSTSSSLPLDMTSTPQYTPALYTSEEPPSTAPFEILPQDTPMPADSPSPTKIDAVTGQPTPDETPELQASLSSCPPWSLGECLVSSPVIPYVSEEGTPEAEKPGSLLFTQSPNFSPEDNMDSVFTQELRPSPNMEESFPPRLERPTPLLVMESPDSSPQESVESSFGGEQSFTPDMEESDTPRPGKLDPSFFVQSPEYSPEGSLDLMPPGKQRPSPGFEQPSPPPAEEPTPSFIMQSPGFGLPESMEPMVPGQDRAPLGSTEVLETYTIEPAVQTAEEDDPNKQFPLRPSDGDFLQDIPTPSVASMETTEASPESTGHPTETKNPQEQDQDKHEHPSPDVGSSESPLMETSRDPNPFSREGPSPEVSSEDLQERPLAESPKLEESTAPLVLSSPSPKRKPLLNWTPGLELSLDPTFEYQYSPESGGKPKNLRSPEPSLDFMPSEASSASPDFSDMQYGPLLSEHPDTTPEQTFDQALELSPGPSKPRPRPLQEVSQEPTQEGLSFTPESSPGSEDSPLRPKQEMSPGALPEDSPERSEPPHDMSKPRPSQDALASLEPSPFIDTVTSPESSIDPLDVRPTFTKTTSDLPSNVDKPPIKMEPSLGIESPQVTGTEDPESTIEPWPKVSGEPSFELNTPQPYLEIPEVTGVFWPELSFEPSPFFGAPHIWSPQVFESSPELSLGTARPHPDDSGKGTAKPGISFSPSVSTEASQEFEEPTAHPDRTKFMEPSAEFPTGPSEDPSHGSESKKPKPSGTVLVELTNVPTPEYTLQPTSEMDEPDKDLLEPGETMPSVSFAPSEELFKPSPQPPRRELPGQSEGASFGISPEVPFVTERPNLRPSQETYPEESPAFRPELSLEPSADFGKQPSGRPQEDGKEPKASNDAGTEVSLEPSSEANKALPLVIVDLPELSDSPWVGFSLEPSVVADDPQVRPTGVNSPESSDGTWPGFSQESSFNSAEPQAEPSQKMAPYPSGQVLSMFSTEPLADFSTPLPGFPQMESLDPSSDLTLESSFEPSMEAKRPHERPSRTEDPESTLSPGFVFEPSQGLETSHPERPREGPLFPSPQVDGPSVSPSAKLRESQRPAAVTALPSTVASKTPSGEPSPSRTSKPSGIPSPSARKSTSPPVDETSPSPTGILDVRPSPSPPTASVSKPPRSSVSPTRDASASVSAQASGSAAPPTGSSTPRLEQPSDGNLENASPELSDPDLTPTAGLTPSDKFRPALSMSPALSPQASEDPLVMETPSSSGMESTEPSPQKEIAVTAAPSTSSFESSGSLSPSPSETKGPTISQPAVQSLKPSPQGSSNTPDVLLSSTPSPSVSGKLSIVTREPPQLSGVPSTTSSPRASFPPGLSPLPSITSTPTQTSRPSALAPATESFKPSGDVQATEEPSTSGNTSSSVDFTPSPAGETATPVPTITNRPTETPTFTFAPTTISPITTGPTKTPTPTFTPSIRPTKTPTPTFKPSIRPTKTPTPTFKPSIRPTKTPTPTFRPSIKPTKTPTPTFRPMLTMMPSFEPMETPTTTFGVTETPNSTFKLESPTPTFTPIRTPSPTFRPTETTTPTKSLKPVSTPTRPEESPLYTDIPPLEPTPLSTRRPIWPFIPSEEPIYSFEPRISLEAAPSEELTPSASGDIGPTPDASFDADVTPSVSYESQSAVPTPSVSTSDVPRSSPSSSFDPDVTAIPCANRANITAEEENLEAAENFQRVKMALQVAGSELTNSCGFTVGIMERFVNLSAANTQSSEEFWFITSIEDGPPVTKRGGTLVAIEEIDGASSQNQSTTPSPSISSGAGPIQLFPGSVIFFVTVYMTPLSVQLARGAYVEYVESQNMVLALHSSGYTDIEWTGIVVYPEVLDVRIDAGSESNSLTSYVAPITAAGMALFMVGGAIFMLFKDSFRRAAAVPANESPVADMV